MGSTDFKRMGFVQQYGAVLIYLSRVADAALIVLSLYVVLLVHGETWSTDNLARAVVAITLFQFVTSFFDLYRPWRMARLRYEILRVLCYWSIAFSISNLLLAITNSEVQPVDLWLRWFALASFLMMSSRILLRMVLRHFRAIGFDQRRVAIAGCNETAKNLEQIFAGHPWMGIEVVGFFDDRSIDGPRPLGIPRSSYLGRLSNLVEMAVDGGIDAVYICLPMGAERRIKTIVDGFSNTTVSVYYCPSFFGFGLLNARWDDVFGQPVVSIVDSPILGPERALKRFEDILLSILVMPLLALPLLFIALAVALTSPGPVFFLQTRYGLDGRPFRIWKFRTMYAVEKDHEFRQAVKGDPRITRIGHFLRRTSLDELPQIFNVIRGDMSFVGPRPHPVALNEAHREIIFRYMLRHKVKPGITGLAQVHGFRGETDSDFKMAARIEYDLRYIREWSIWLDINILLRTPMTVISGQNAH